MVPGSRGNFGLSKIQFHIFSCSWIPFLFFVFFLYSVQLETPPVWIVFPQLRHLHFSVHPIPSVAHGHFVFFFLPSLQDTRSVSSLFEFFDQNNNRRALKNPPHTRSSRSSETRSPSVDQVTGSCENLILLFMFYPLFFRQKDKEKDQKNLRRTATTKFDV